MDDTWADGWGLVLRDFVADFLPVRRPTGLRAHYRPRMALPRPLLRLIDPAQLYFDRHSIERRRGGPPLYLKAAVFGPGVPGGSRAATDHELAALAEEAGRHRREYEAALADAKRRWAPELQRAVNELLDRGATQIRLGDRTVDARIITFWRGDHLLHTAMRGPSGTGESLTRISRGRRRGGIEVLFDYLARAAMKG